MMKERYRNMMEQVTLSEQARAAFAEKLEQKKTARRKVRPLQVAAIAACLCLALMGTAFAVEAITGIGVIEYIRGEYGTFYNWRNGTTEVKPMVGYTTDYTNVKSYPITAFSEEVRNLDGALFAEHQSWDEVERYLGLDLMNNPVLADPSMIPLDNTDMTALGLDDKVHCYTLIEGVEGQLYRASAVIRYTTKRAWPGRSKGENFYAEIEARATAEHPTFDEDEVKSLHWSGIGYPEELGVEFSESQYVAPSGLTAAIVTYHWESGSEEYFAYFSLNGVTFSVSVGGPMGFSDKTWEFMTEILDAFEF